MRLKYFSFLFFSMILVLNARAQIGTPTPLGYINLAKGSYGKIKSVGKSTLSVCTPRSYSCNNTSTLTYIFIGNGNWNIPENWLNNLIPPALLTMGYQILINSEGGGQCILNISQAIGPGANLTVLPNKKLRVPGRILIQ